MWCVSRHISQYLDVIACFYSLFISYFLAQLSPLNWQSVGPQKRRAGPEHSHAHWTSRVRRASDLDVCKQPTSESRGERNPGDEARQTKKEKNKQSLWMVLHPTSRRDDIERVSWRLPTRMRLIFSLCSLCQKRKMEVVWSVVMRRVQDAEATSLQCWANKINNAFSDHVDNWS